MAHAENTGELLDGNTVVQGIDLYDMNQFIL